MIPEIIKNGDITVESIFMFSDGYPQISSFLQKCQAQNCRVHFCNEDITIAPGDLADTGVSAMITTYGMLILYPKAARDFVNYALNNASKR